MIYRSLRAIRRHVRLNERIAIGRRLEYFGLMKDKFMKILFSVLFALILSYSAFAEEVLSTCGKYKIVFTGVSEGLVAGIKVSQSDIFLQFPHSPDGKTFIKSRLALSVSHLGSVGHMSVGEETYIFSSGATNSLTIYDGGSVKKFECQ